MKKLSDGDFVALVGGRTVYQVLVGDLGLTSKQAFREIARLGCKEGSKANGEHLIDLLEIKHRIEGR